MALKKSQKMFPKIHSFTQMDGLETVKSPACFYTRRRGNG
jgi:hypothetical protein